MKKRIVLNVAMATALLGTAMFTSCSKDDMAGIDTSSSSSEVSIAGAKTNIKAFSNGVELSGIRRASTFSDYVYTKVVDWEGDKTPDETQMISKMGSEAVGKTVWSYKPNAPQQNTDHAGDLAENVSDAEAAYVIQYLHDHPNEGSTECNITDFYMQNVGGSHDTYTTTPDQNGATDVVDGTSKMDYLVIDGKHDNDFNHTWGHRVLMMNASLANPTYKDSYGEGNLTRENHYRFYKITYLGKTNYYLCFDWATAKYDGAGGTVGKSYPGDGVYNDWVIKIIPGDGVVEPDPTPDPDPTPNPDPEPDPTPDPKPDPEPEPAITINKGEIEVNLAFNEPKDAEEQIVSHLSIHVRDTSNVTVFIPIAKEYYCPEDDMYIVKNHREAEGISYKYGHTTQTWNIAGHDVTLTVAYEDAGIRVTTAGINAEVLKELRSQYHDGITFEVWNYYNSTKTRDELQALANNSTVTFTEDNVYQYVNAFGKIKDDWDTENAPYTDINPRACTVTLTNTTFTEQTAWEELINGHKVNQVYTNNAEVAKITEAGETPQPAAYYIALIEEENAKKAAEAAASAGSGAGE